MANLEVLKFCALVVRDPLQKSAAKLIVILQTASTPLGVATGQKEARRTPCSVWSGMQMLNVNTEYTWSVCKREREREGRRCQELAFLRLCRRVYDAQQVGGRHCHTEILRELRVGLEHLGMVRHDRM